MIGISIILLIIATLLNAAQADEGEYYNGNRPKRGWWWYEKTPAPKKEAPKKDSKQAPASPKQEEQPQILSRQQLWGMKPSEAQKYIDNIRDEAIRNPTEQNVYAYYDAMDVSRLKAQAFTNVSEYVWQKYPELTTRKDTPNAVPGITAFNEQKTAEVAGLLQANQESYALIHFTRQSCQYCEAQRGILKYLTIQTGWPVREVDVQDNPALAAKMAVSTTPTLIMIKKGSKDWFPVSAGVISLDELQTNLYRAVRLMNGEIKPEEFKLYEFQRGGGYDVKARGAAPQQ